MRQINKIIVHCTDSPRDDSMETIRQWHIRDNGWKDIGYHFVIRRNGNIEIGRPIDKPGAHAQGHNAYSVGIVLCGKDQFEDQQFYTLRKLVLNIMKIFGLDQDAVIGHRDVNPNKTCPNFDVRAMLWGQ